MTFDAVPFWLVTLTSIPLYWLLPSSGRNFFLLTLSYYFYSAWDVRFLGFLILSTLVDFMIGPLAAPGNTKKTRKLAVTLSLSVNLGLLILCKHYGFFVDSAKRFLGLQGVPFLDFILEVGFPLGISFYTFQTISYTLDIYRGRIHPTKKLLDFALYVAFFPQLVAGPIERAKRLLPQIERPRELDWLQLETGFHLIVLGLFKKIFVSSLLEQPVQYLFLNPLDNSYATLLGGLLMTLLVYSDFSGYSDIARGLAKCFGIEIIINFKPFIYAKNPSDFWNRWHRSLTRWIRDYLFVDVGVRKWSQIKKTSHLFVVFFLIGLWHDIHWAWILFGGFHGCCVLGFQIYRRQKWDFSRYLSKPGFAIVSQFLMILFFALSGFFHMLYEQGLPSGFTKGFGFLNLIESFSVGGGILWFLLPALLPLALFEYFQEKTQDYDFIVKQRLWAKTLFLSYSFAGILFFERVSQLGFIYFDF